MVAHRTLVHGSGHVLVNGVHAHLETPGELARFAVSGSYEITAQIEGAIPLSDRLTQAPHPPELLEDGHVAEALFAEIVCGGKAGGTGPDDGNARVAVRHTPSA